jgi:transcriptional regulator with XRE-family HTH domain
MCYYSPSRIVGLAHRRGRAMSALVNYINHRMKELKKIPAQVADDGGLSRSALSYILKQKMSGKSVRPEPDTIKKIAKGLEVHPSLLTSLMGYSVEPIPGVDERLYEIARQLLGAPWVADRLNDFVSLPQDEFEDLINWLEFQKGRAGGSANRSTP